MVSRARTDAEEAQRLLVASLNGLAALALLRNEPHEAIRYYREALRQEEATRGVTRVDPWQQLHTMVREGMVIVNIIVDIIAVNLYSCTSGWHRGGVTWVDPWQQLHTIVRGG